MGSSRCRRSKVSSYLFLRKKRGIQVEVSKGFSRFSSSRRHKAGDLFKLEPVRTPTSGSVRSSVAGRDGGNVIVRLRGVMLRAEFVTVRTSISCRSVSDTVTGHMEGDESAIL